MTSNSLKQDAWKYYWDQPLEAEFYREWAAKSEKDVREELPVSNRIPQCNTLLDAGCGTGRYIPLLYRKAKTYVALDSSAEMLRVAKNDWGHLPNVQFIHSDIETFTYPEGFDVVLCMGVLRHLPMDKDERVLRNLIKLTKGTLFFEVPSWPFSDPIPLDEYSGGGGGSMVIRDHPIRLEDIESWISPYKISEKVKIQDIRVAGNFGRANCRPRRLGEPGVTVSPSQAGMVIKTPDGKIRSPDGKIDVNTPITFVDFAKVLNEAGYVIEYQVADRYLLIVNKSV